MLALPFALALALTSSPQETGAPKAEAVGSEAQERDEPYRVAVAYLKALDGTGDQKAREFLLGGRTLTAEEVGIPSWRTLGREVMRGKQPIADAVRAMTAVDKPGHQALDQMVSLGEGEDAVVALT